jgi:hypothetical protein
MIMTLFIMRFCIPTCGIYTGGEVRVKIYAFNHQDFMTNRLNKHLGKAACSKHKYEMCTANFESLGRPRQQDQFVH